MSVFSVEPKPGNPVTSAVLDEACKALGVTLKDAEKEDYRRLLAVFHESAEELMNLPDYEPPVDLGRFPRRNVYLPDKKDNPNGAWAWKFDLMDTNPHKHTGILRGKTVALKDNIAVKDVPMLLGTEFVKGFVPTTDATVVTRILEAGARIKGKAVCENLCHSATSHSAATGVVDNPYVAGYSSGGSSSGCGVLVSLGEVDLAIGADQGGSVRIPSCNCGIVGFKPTFGMIPYTACGSNEPTNDHLGPMTRTVLDNAYLLQVVAGSDNIDDRGFAAPAPEKVPKYGEILAQLSNPKDLSGLRIGILSESLTGAVLDPRVRDTILKASAKFKELGAQVTDISVPLHKKGTAIWTGVSKIGGYLSKTSGAFGRRGHNLLKLHELMWPLKQENWDDAYVSTKNIYLNGAYAAEAFPYLLAKSTNLSRQLRDAYDAAFREVDLLITPTLPYLATSHCAEGATPLEQIAKQVGLTSSTCQFNQTGHPALTLPVAMLEIIEGPARGTGKKLPVGMQIVGKWWDEETILRAAYAWELTNNWKTL